MTKFYLASFITCFLVSNSIAQKKQNVYFLKNDGRYVDKKSDADYIRIVQEPDSGSVLYNIIEYYPNGNTKLVGQSTTVIPIMLEGTAISYYPNKKKKQVATYQHHYFSGFVYDYYPNGQFYRGLEYISFSSGIDPNPFLTGNVIVNSVNDSTGKATVTDGKGHYQIYDDDFQYVKEAGDLQFGKRMGSWKGFSPQGKTIYQENFANGEFLNGIKINEKGDTTKYTVKEALPMYKGGDQAFGNFLSKNIYYPSFTVRQGLQGTVLVSFLVDKTGGVSNVKILKSLSLSTDAAVIRLIKSTKKWIPGIENGMPVVFKGMTTVTFMIPTPTKPSVGFNRIFFEPIKTR